MQLHSSDRLKWKPHPLRSFIVERVGEHPSCRLLSAASHAVVKRVHHKSPSQPAPSNVSADHCPNEIMALPRCANPFPTPKFSAGICSLFRRIAHTGCMPFQSTSPASAGESNLSEMRPVYFVGDVPGPYPHPPPPPVFPHATVNKTFFLLFPPAKETKPPKIPTKTERKTALFVAKSRNPATRVGGPARHRFRTLRAIVHPRFHLG